MLLSLRLKIYQQGFSKIIQFLSQRIVLLLESFYSVLIFDFSIVLMHTSLSVASRVIVVLFLRSLRLLKHFGSPFQSLSSPEAVEFLIDFRVQSCFPVSLTPWGAYV